MRYNLERPTEPRSRPGIQLPENSHQCALLGNDQLAPRKNPRVSNMS